MKRLLAKLFSLAVRLRTGLYRRGLLRSCSLKYPVISVGNLTVGGTGKTPYVQFLSRVFQESGFQPVILTRGYGGRPRQTPLLVTDGQGILTTPEESGDEPFLLANKLRGVPIIVGRDRVRSGKFAERRFGPVLHILDDGFQHLRLKRDLDILIVDGTDPSGGDALLPAGRLREPLSAASRADLIVVTRAHLTRNAEEIELLIRRVNPLAPIHYFYHDAVGFTDLRSGEKLPLRELLNQKVVALAAIGNPRVFLRDLAHYQIRVVETCLFRDHYPYEQTDLDRAAKKLREAGARAVVTTEKDAVRMQHLNLDSCTFLALEIETRTENLEEYRNFILREVTEIPAVR